jgi:dihydroorotate dehydrogenase (NAD+) catalytic subunit
MNPKLSVKIGKLKLANPVVVASGTFGYGEEFADFIDLKTLGAIFSKTITLKPRAGNLPPRTCETPAGMLNSIGLENPGVEVFLEEKLPILISAGVPIIVSIASEKTPQEFVVLVRQLDRIKEIAAIELNISCPNVRGKRIAARRDTRLIAQDARTTYSVVKAVRKVTQKTLITKLTPNVTDIVDIAQAAKSAGSDALALINTIYGMSIDVATRRSKIAMVSGGLSGPAIRPVALRMVWEVFQKVKLPIIGMGGIMDTKSALEFFIAGATAISIGTANFVNPKATTEILTGIKKYLAKNNIKDIKSLIGSLQT